MNKDYIVVAEQRVHINVKTMDDAKKVAKQLLEDGFEEACIYELKSIASIEKPKVEFKEV